MEMRKGAGCGYRHPMIVIMLTSGLASGIAGAREAPTSISPLRAPGSSRPAAPRVGALARPDPAVSAVQELSSTVERLRDRLDAYDRELTARERTPARDTNAAFLPASRAPRGQAAVLFSMTVDLGEAVAAGDRRQVEGDVWLDAVEPGGRLLLDIELAGGLRRGHPLEAPLDRLVRTLATGGSGPHRRCLALALGSMIAQRRIGGVVKARELAVGLIEADATLEALGRDRPPTGRELAARIHLLHRAMGAWDLAQDNLMALMEDPHPTPDGTRALHRMVGVVETWLSKDPAAFGSGERWGPGTTWLDLVLLLDRDPTDPSLPDRIRRALAVISWIQRDEPIRIGSDQERNRVLEALDRLLAGTDAADRLGVLESIRTRVRAGEAAGTAPAAGG